MILLLACIGSEPTEDSALVSEDTDDSAVSGESALLSRIGRATVGSDYVGSEALVITADEGEGEEICRIEQTLTSTGTRDDCEYCDWAFDLVVSDATAVVDTRCADFGLDAGALNGTTRSYGYTAEYIGHAQVILVEQDGAWVSVSFATYTDGVFEYDWEDGFLSAE